MRRADALPRLFLQVLATVLIVALAAFFGFVGYMKTTAPLATLAQHHAWTVTLPEWLGRLIGLSEMACAMALAVARLWPGRIGLAAPVASVLLVNQLVAAAVHVGKGETGALPQNGALIAMLVVLALAARRLRSGGSE